MKRIVLLILAILFGLVPTVIFVFYFRFSQISSLPGDWAVFATYFSGLTGTLFSLIAGWLLYLTLKSQDQQNVESIFFNFLNSFSKEKELLGKLLIVTEELMRKEVHKNERVKKGSDEERHKKGQYFDFIKRFFIADYSINTKSPRLYSKFSKYFRSIETLAELVNDSRLSAADQMRLKKVLLSVFNDEEIKMICYYYYLLFDIVNSDDDQFATLNPVKELKIFEGEWHFADHFPHEFDPRKGDFSESIIASKNFYRAKRLER